MIAVRHRVGEAMIKRIALLPLSGLQCGVPVPFQFHNERGELQHRCGHSVSVRCRNRLVLGRFSTDAIWQERIVAANPSLVRIQTGHNAR